jgi:hypothetical protein
VPGCNQEHFDGGTIDDVSRMKSPLEDKYSHWVNPPFSAEETLSSYEIE